ncbi:MAG: DNA/RNA nuclease SfsA [Nitrospinae bacterium]|nr:DNA/RNA nuclease SfsA [Nitrospinota bacterium]
MRKVNRFLALVEVEGEIVKAHIPNSGRLTELMTTGHEAALSKAPPGSMRKTAFTLRSVHHNGRWVCVDSTIPNRLAEEMARSRSITLFEGYDTVRREVTVGHHRFDLMLTGANRKPLLVEVKSVTLVENGVAMFPDAPTQRGRSHLETLTRLLGEGYNCVALFIVQRDDAKSFTPNTRTDPEFSKALMEASLAGVCVKALWCEVNEREITAKGELPVNL